MKAALAVLLAAIAAAVVQAPLMMCYSLPVALLSGSPAPFDQLMTGLLGASIYVSVVALVFIVVLGIPAFMGLQRTQRPRMWRAARAGFVAAALPLGMLLWPREHPGLSSSGSWGGHLVDFYINGRPTRYEYMSYVLGVLQFGVHGIAGGITFLWVWRRFQSEARDK